MKYNKGIVPVLIALIVVGVIAVGGVAYYVGNNSSKVYKEIKVESNQLSKENNSGEVKNLDSNIKINNVIDKVNTPNLNTEEPSSEVFKDQPGAIKSLKSDGSNRWVIAVDLLSNNSKWLPGVDSTGRPFINQNSKIRSLNVTGNTKTYNCENAKPSLLVDTSSFLSTVQNNINKGDYTYKNEFVGPMRYFDINGINISAMYEQCLP